MSEQRPPLPPFTHETAVQKVRGAEDGWNSRNPERVSLAYTIDSYWRRPCRVCRGTRGNCGFPHAQVEL